MEKRGTFQRDPLMSFEMHDTAVKHEGQTRGEPNKKSPTDGLQISSHSFWKWRWNR